MSFEVGQVLLRQLSLAQRHIGEARLQIGLILSVFRNNDSLWIGQSESFEEFLEDQKIPLQWAETAMRVATKLCLDLKLSDMELSVLSKGTFKTLDKAAAVIDNDNKGDVIAIVAALSERDALAALGEMLDGTSESMDLGFIPRPVQAAVSAFMDLPDDYRQVFFDECRRRCNRGRPKGAGGQTS